MSERLQISFDGGRRLAVIMRDQQAPEPIEGHPGLWWIEGILTTQEPGTLMRSRKLRNNADCPCPLLSPGRSRFAKVAPWKLSPTQPPLVGLSEDRQRHAWVEHAADLLPKASKADDDPELIEETTRQVERALKQEGLM